jgi:outer membrane protein assembly factor BamB
MLAIAPLWLMMTVANPSAQAQTSADASTTATSTPSETVLGVGNVGNLKLKWKEGVGTIVQSDLASVVANGIIYGSQTDNQPFALNASTGALLWLFLAEKAGGSPLSLSNGVVYVDGEDNNLYAVNASNGAELWSFTSAGSLSFTVASGGVVYVGTGSSSSFTGPGTVDALNANNGAKLWSFAVDGFPWSSTVANGVVYIADGTVDALNASTGAKLWSFATSGTVVSSPTVANGVVYIASTDGTLSALNASTGAKLWDFAADGFALESSPAVANGVVYVSSEDHNVYALNASTGAKLWSFATGFGLDSSPAVANGVVYFGSSDHNVYALNASTGAKLWSYSPPSDPNFFTNFSGINVVDGVVYVAGDRFSSTPEPDSLGDQDLYAFSVGADLFLRAQPSATTVHQGDLLTYAFPVWNLGPSNAVHEVLNTQVPLGTTFNYIRISGTPGLGTCTTPKYLGTGQIVCHENASMAPNTTWTVRLTVRVTAPAGTVITENAATLADTLDPLTANNTATVSVKVQ